MATTTDKDIVKVNINNATDKALRNKANKDAWVDKSNSGIQAYEVMSGNSKKAGDAAEDAEAEKQIQQDSARKAFLSSKGKTDADMAMDARITKLKNYTSGKSNNLD